MSPALDNWSEPRQNRLRISFSPLSASPRGLPWSAAPHDKWENSANSGRLGESYFLQACHLSQWFIMTYFWSALRSKSRFIIDFQDEDSQSASSSSKMVICLEDKPSCTVCHFGIDSGTVLFSFGGRVHGVSKPLLSMRYPRRSWFLMQRNEGTQRDLQDSLFPTMPGLVTVLRAMTSVQTQVYFHDDMGLLM